jgi:hypothetical protein
MFYWNYNLPDITWKVWNLQAGGTLKSTNTVFWCY